MRQKNTDIVEGQDNFRQFQSTKDQIKESKWEKAERIKRDEKQGLSQFRVEKIVKK